MDIENFTKAKIKERMVKKINFSVYGAVRLLFLFLLLNSMCVFGFEEVCTGPNDGVRAKRVLAIAEGKQQEFIESFRTNAAKNVYSTGEMESVDHLVLFLNVSGVYISVEYTLSGHKFLLELETCNATEDWLPHWQYLNDFVAPFEISSPI